jgi:uncharacterized protein (DUF1501 family)
MHRDFNTVRRQVLNAGLAAGTGLVSALGAPSARATSAAGPSKKLVVVMLRGAVDGLSVVVPHADPDYRRNRPEIAIASPGAADGALRLNAHFGLHPALAGLMPWWQSGRLGFVHASGSHDPTRSHFDAQDHMESATPGRRSTPEGWMNRLLTELAAGPTDPQVQGVNLGTAMPRILAGPAQVAALPLAVNDRPGIAPSAAQTAALDRLFAAQPSTERAWSTLRQTQETITQAMAQPAMSPSSMSPANMGASGMTQAQGMDAGTAPGAVPLVGLANEASRLGRLLRHEPGLRAAFLSVGGWDTHVAQGAARGALADRLRGLAGGLNALAGQLGEQLDHTVIVVLSEFGRTVRQNGTRGTDHGHGNVMWLLGGPVQGGRVAGEWPGLEQSAQHDGRDLAVTTDFRQVLAEVLERHMRLDERALAQVLPDGPGPGSRPGVIAG